MKPIKKNQAHRLGLAVSASFLCFFLFSSCQGFDSEILYKYAQRLHDQGNYKKAISYYEKCVKLDPENAIIHYDLGVAYVDYQQYDKARQQIRTLTKLKRDDLAEELTKVLKRVSF